MNIILRDNYLKLNAKVDVIKTYFVVSYNLLQIVSASLSAYNRKNYRYKRIIDSLQSTAARRWRKLCVDVRAAFLAQ